MLRASMVAVIVWAIGVVPTAQAAPCAGFNDVDDTSVFCANVAWMKNRGVTQGCAAGLYCPNDPVSRLAMAAFISRLDRVLTPTVVDANVACGHADGGEKGTYREEMADRHAWHYVADADAVHPELETGF